MKTVSAIVPMKGESVRLPHKNVKQFNGKPLFYWILESLSKTRNVLSIYVDTDSDQIKSLVRSTFPNVAIIDRPTELCGNTISMNQILSHDLSVIPNEHLLQTHVTNPLLQPNTIKSAVDLYFEGLKTKFDSLFSVTTWYKRLYDYKGLPLNHDPEKLLNTQDLDPIYEENSNLYIFSKGSFQSNNSNRLGKKPKLFPTPMLESIDIDYYEEFVLAEACSKVNGVMKVTSV